VRFFVPQAAEGEAEQVYGQLAQLCRRPVPALPERVCSITYMHDGDYWTATVGEQLRGSRTRQRQRRGRKVPVTTPLADEATVLAIFAGDPYLVVTNARPLGGARSAWVNPFMAGRPESVQHFSSE